MSKAVMKGSAEEWESQEGLVYVLWCLLKEESVKEK